MRCAVFSDDLSGAHNIGVEFAQNGFHTAIINADRAPLPADVLVVNTNSRYETPEIAYRSIIDAVSTLHKHHMPDLYIKKIDSLLRGNIGTELDALLNTAGLQRCLVVAASPRLGRTTVGGYQLVDGVPITQMTQLDPISRVTTAHIPTLIADQSDRPVHHIALDNAAPDFTLSGHIVADAANIAQMYEIVARAHAAGVRCFAGTYGLGDAICHFIAPSVDPVLIVVGSLSDPSRAQAQHLATRVDCAYLAVDPNTCDWLAIRTQIETALSQRKHPVIHLTHEITPTESLKAGAATALHPLMKRFGGFIATGGATAQMVLELIGADGLRVEPIELFPGTPSASIIGGTHDDKPFLAKPGAQGERYALDILLTHALTMQRTKS